MKNHLLLISVFIIYVQFSFGQGETEVIWQPVQKVSKGITVGKIIGTDESGIYLLKSQYNEAYLLEHLNHELVKTKTERILKSETNTTKYEGVIHFGDKIYLLTSFMSQKQKKRFFNTQLIDKETLKVSDEKQEIAEYDMSNRSKPPTAGFTVMNVGDFHYILSKDKSKLLVYGHLPESKQKDPDVRLAFYVFDSDMNKIWSKNVTLPYKEDTFNPWAFRVSNQGTVYMIGKKKSKKKNLVVGYSNDLNSYSYDLILFRYSGEDSKEYTISQDEYFVPEVQLAFEENGDVVCAGFYLDSEVKSIKIKKDEDTPNSFEMSKGIFLLRVDGETGEIKDKSFDEFRGDLIVENPNENNTRKDLPKPIRYEMKNVVVRENGELLLVGELIHKYSLQGTVASGLPNMNMVNMRDDILVISMNEKDIEWSRKIPKRQITTGIVSMGLSSFSTFEDKDKLYFVFSEHENSLDYKDKKTLKKLLDNKEEYVTSIVEVDREGNINRDKLFSVRDKEVLLRTHLSNQISDNEAIIVGKKDKKYRLAKIIFK